MTDDVLERAKDLGRRIADDPRTRALREASTAVAADPGAKRLEEDYARAAEDVREREESGRPVEPEQKRRLAALAEQVRRSPVLQRLLQAHHDFAEMMDGVQRAIGEPVDAALTPNEPAQAPGASKAPGSILIP